MNYIIFDLEWNNYYNYKHKTGINEIIEIGAVKLNDSLDVVDTFKQLIKPRVTKKLGSRFKNLTHITMEEINKNGIDFDAAFSDFARWTGNSDCVFLSWSTSDLYTLVDNFKRFKNKISVDFMKKYADAQSYCMQFIDEYDGNQISLSNCADKFGIEVDTTNLHRALEDCMVTVHCFRKVFDKKKFSEFVKICDKAFFERLVFKPYFISKPVCGSFDVGKIMFSCSECGGDILPMKEYEFSNNCFKGAGQCEKCKKKFWLFIRAKQNYDNVAVSKRLVQINKKRAKYIK